MGGSASARNSKDLLIVVARRRAHSPFEATPFAPMVNPGILAFYLNPDRAHRTFTLAGAVAGLDIHMFAPQAMGAMVGIAISLNGSTAVLANKILDCALKISARH